MHRICLPMHTYVHYIKTCTGTYTLLESGSLTLVRNKSPNFLSSKSSIV